MTQSEQLDESRADQGAAGDAKPRGRSPLRKLSDERELELMHLYRDTQTSVPDIARRFGVGESSVYRIAQKHGASLRSATGGRARGDAPASASTNGESMNGARARTRRPRRGSGGTAPGSARARTGRRRSTDGAASRTAPSPSSAGTPAVSVERGAGARGARRFRVAFRGETTVEAESIRDAIGKVEALGATDVTSVALMD